MTSLQPREDTELPYVREDDWDNEEMPVRPVRKRLGAWSLLLVGAVIAAGSFYGGVMIEKHHVPSSSGGGGGGGAGAAARAAAAGTGTGAGTAAAGGRTGAAGAGAGATGAGGAGATFGTVKLVDGNNVYVQDATGNITKVATTAQSTITITSTGKVSSIKPGDTVVVRGTTGANGTVNATAITDAGAGGAGLGGFGGGFRRGAAGAAGGAGAGAAAGGGGGGPVIIGGGGGGLGG